MSRHRQTIASCVAALAFVATGTAHAAACWDAPSIGAARISELETMLMVVSLRCRAKGYDYHESYERFADSYKETFSAAQLTLKTHFDAGSDGGRRAYDSYLIAVANYYGAGKTDAETCHGFEAVSNELGGAAAKPELLPLIAMEMVQDPRIAGTRCPVVQAQTNAVSEAKAAVQSDSDR